MYTEIDLASMCVINDQARLRTSRPRSSEADSMVCRLILIGTVTVGGALA
jgi:hypothetical protein